MIIVFDQTASVKENCRIYSLTSTATQRYNVFMDTPTERIIGGLLNRIIELEVRLYKALEEIERFNGTEDDDRFVDEEPICDCKRCR